ncbi:hypothetical protein B0H19DRAFT_1157061 [Mycena capillaripes]|nr:hypothetical protein B0H19DRAFT_1157061 [Mycena capillaripes]
MVLDWLKRSQSLPEDLVHLWEDYCFMSHYESILHGQREFNGIQVTEKDWDHYRQMLLQASPSFLRIFRAIPFVHGWTQGWTSCLLSVRMQLNISWDELRIALCFLRSLKDQDGGDLEGFIMKVLIVALDHTLLPCNFDSMMWDLACSTLYAMLQVVRGEMGKCILTYLMGWGRYLRSCPPSQKLLRDLCDTEPIWKDIYGETEASDPNYHSIIQWLKTFPEPPQELIIRVEGYMERQRESTGYTHGYEDDWRKDNPHKRYHDLSEARTGARAL